MERAGNSWLQMAAGALPRQFNAVTAIALLLLASVPPLAITREGAAQESQGAERDRPSANATTVRLGKGRTETRLDRNQDYIIKLPKGVKNGHTFIDGGRNVLIEGGTIVMNGQGSDLERRAIYIKNATGTVRIQNVVIRGRKGAAFDAIAIDAPQAVVELVNIRVTGVYGRSNGYHGDIVQPFGGVKKLVVNGLTGRSAYQGLYLVETAGRIGSVELRNVDLAYHTNRHDETTFLLWLHGCSSYPVTLRDVYIQPRKGERVAKSAVQSGGCNPTQRGNKVSWPRSSAIDGTIIEGTPPGGAFVPPRVGR